MVSPDCLTEEFNSPDVARRRAALDTIGPSIRSPAKIVCHAVRVSETKAGKANLRVAIRDIVLVAFGIEQQRGWVQHKNATAPTTTLLAIFNPVTKSL